MCLWPGFVCRGQYWLVYHLVLSVMDSYGWYSTRFCLSWIILVGISPCFVCRGQKWMVYQPVLSVMEIIRDYNIGTLVIARSINPKPHYQARER